MARNRSILKEEKVVISQIVSKIIGITAKKLATRGLGSPDSEDIPAHVSKWSGILFQSSSLQVKSFHSIHPWDIRKRSTDLTRWIKEQKSKSLFFDGASRGNPREAGARGVILDPRGQMIKTFAWGLGNKTNNEAEWLTLFQGLEMVGTSSISNLIVFGVSRQVILKVKNGYPTGSINCRRIYSRISQLHIPENTTFFHILRANNAKADSLENRGVSLPQGSILLNDEATSVKYIP